MNRFHLLLAIASAVVFDPALVSAKKAKPEPVPAETPEAVLVCSHDYQTGPWEPDKDEIAVCRKILQKNKLDAIELYSALWTVGQADLPLAKKFLPDIQVLLKRQVKAKLRVDLGGGTNSSLWGVAVALEGIGPAASVAVPDLKAAYGFQKTASGKVTIGSAIASISPKTGIPLLLKDIPGPGHVAEVGEVAVEAALYSLGRYGKKSPTAMGSISKYVIVGAWHESVAAVEALVMLENPKAVPRISAGLESGSWRVVLAAVRGLEAYGAASLPEAPKLAAVAASHWSNRVRLEAARVFQELTGEGLPVVAARFDPPPCLKADGHNASVLVDGEEILFHNYFVPPVPAQGEMPPDGGFPEMEPAHWARVPIYGEWTPVHPVDPHAGDLLALKRKPKYEPWDPVTTYPVADRGWLVGYGAGEFGGRIEWLDAVIHANKVVWRGPLLPVYDFVESRNGLLVVGGKVSMDGERSGGVLQVAVGPELAVKVQPLAELPGDIVAVAVSRTGKLYVVVDLSLDWLARYPDSDIATLGENVFELDRAGRLRLLSCEAD